MVYRFPSVEISAGQIIGRVLADGADLAGIVNLGDVLKVDSPLRSQFAGSSQPVTQERGAVREKSLLVLGLHHPPERPEMDWWHGKYDPPGNRMLRRIVADLVEWMRGNSSISVTPYPYAVEKGGIYLKDAAVHAGLGVIGKNNLLITPEFGPRVRLRAVGLSHPFPSSPAADFSPCQACSMVCRKSCPEQAMDSIVDDAEHQYGVKCGQDGCYSRKLCYLQMIRNERDGALSPPHIRYCRECELGCIAGKDVLKS